MFQGRSSGSPALFTAFPFRSIETVAYYGERGFPDVTAGAGLQRRDHSRFSRDSLLSLRTLMLSLIKKYLFVKRLNLRREIITAKLYRPLHPMPQPSGSASKSPERHAEPARPGGITSKHSGRKLKRRDCLPGMSMAMRFQ
jgi:hypothetical protein